MPPLWGFYTNFLVFYKHSTPLEFFKIYNRKILALEERNIYRKELTNFLKLRRSEMFKSQIQNQKTPLAIMEFSVLNELIKKNMCFTHILNTLKYQFS